MTRRGKPPIFALTTFSLLAVAASVVLAFMASEVYNIGAPAQVVGPNQTDVLAMDIFLADNPVEDVKVMPGERASALGDAIDYFDFTNGFAGYVNMALVPGDPGAEFPANTVFADRGNPGDNELTGQDDQNVADELWVDADTDGEYDAGETDVWWEVEPVEGTRGFGLEAWATAAFGFNPANDALYFKDGPSMHVNTPLWIDFNEDGDASGPAGTGFELEEVIFPDGGGGSGADGTPADPTGPTFGDTPEQEVWGDMNGDETFDNVNDVIWDDERANNMYDAEPVILGAVVSGDAGTAFPNDIMFENEDLDDVWTPATGEDLFEDTNGNGQWDVGEFNFTGGIILAGAPGTPVADAFLDAYQVDGQPAPEFLFVDNGPAGFDLPGDWIFIDTNGSGNYELEPMILGAAPLNGTPGTSFEAGWTFDVGYGLIWVDDDANDEYDSDLVVFGAPQAHPGDPLPLQPTLYDGDEEIFVDNIPAAVGFTGLLSLDPDDPLNQGQDGVNAAHGAPLTFFPDPEADGVERFADQTAPAGEYNDGDEIFEDHDQSETYTARADGVIGGDDGPAPVVWSEGDPLLDPAPPLAFLDLDFDGILSDDEPVVSESMEDNLTMDFGESAIPQFSGPLTSFGSDVFIIDLTADGTYNNGEPIFGNTDEDDFAEPGETALRTSIYATLIPMTPFTNLEFFVGGLADYNDGDDIVGHVLGTGLGTIASFDRIYNFYGPDQTPGVGGDDIIWFDTDNDGIFEANQDDAFMDRNNNRRIDGGSEVPGAVLPGASDLGDPIVPFSPFNFRFNDLNASTAIAVGAEPAYWDTDASNTVTPGDRRIFWYQRGVNVGAFNPNEEDIGAPSVGFANGPAPGPAQTIYLDLDGSTTYDAGEPVYFHPTGFTGNPNPALVSSDVAGTEIVRLIETALPGPGIAYVYPPLSLVHDGDRDLVAPGALFEYFPPSATPGAIVFYDGNLNLAFNPGELVYQDFDNNGLDPGDERIYVYPTGSTVALNDADVGVVITAGVITQDEVAVRDGWGGTPNVYDPGEQVYIGGFFGRFSGYTPGNDGFDGFNVSDVAGDARLTPRPTEYRIIDGAGIAAAGFAVSPFTEDIVPNGVLDANLNELALDETVLGVDLNQDGDTNDTAEAVDLNGNNVADGVLHEDQNYDGVLTGVNGNNLFVRAPFVFPPGGFGYFAGNAGGPFYTPNEDVVRIQRDGPIANIVPGDPTFGVIKDIGGLVKHFDDGGRGHDPTLPPLYDGPFNFRYDDGEAIVFDADDDLRWDPGEQILTASDMPIDPATGAILATAVPAVLQMNSFTAPSFIFADVEGGVANGAYDGTEAIIQDLNDNGRWDNGELVVTNSAHGHLTDWTIEKRVPVGNDFVLDYDTGGTWSEREDTPRDLVDAVLDAAEADPLTSFPADVGYHNVLGVGEYDDFENDEIFLDLDGDGYVTILSDTEIYPQAGPFSSANGDALNQFVAVPPAPAGANRYVGWVDTGNGVYDGDAHDEEDIFYDVDGDGVVDELDDVMTDFALMNPLSANEPTDIVALNLWMEDGTTSGFQAAEDMPVGTGVVDPMDSRSWTWTGLSVPVPSEDRNGDGDDDDVLDESVWSIDFNGDGDLLDVVTEAHPDGRGDTDSQTRMYATIDISADPQNLLIGNQFDATIPMMGVETLALNNGPTDMAIQNSLGVMGGVITIDDYPPTVTRLEQLWLNDFDGDSAPGVQPPNVIAPGDNRYEVSGEVELVFRTPSDSDVRRVKMLWATDEGGPWMPVDTDPDGSLDVGSDGEPGLAGVDDDGDWVAATDDVGADGLPLTGDAGEGNGVPDSGEPGVDRNDPEVAAALLNHLNDGVDNNDDGYIDDFEFEPAGMDVDRDGLVGEGFPEADQTNGIDDDGDGIIDDDGVDVNGNGIFGEPDPTVGPGGDSDYLTMYMYDNDEDGVADMDNTEFMAQLINDNFWNIPDSTTVSFGGSPTMWSFTLDTRLLQYVVNETASLPDNNDIYVKAVAYDLFGNVMPLYAAPAALRLDNLAPAVTVAMTDMQGNPVNDGDQVLDSNTYLVGVTSPDDEVMNIAVNWAVNDDATFGNNLGVIQDVNEQLQWSPAAVGNTPPDETDDYYFEALASDILAWWNETTQQWQPYAFDLDGNPATDPEFIGNAEMSSLPVCQPAIVLNCLVPADAGVAELHVEALNATAPLSAITQIEASPPEIRARGDFADGVRVPAYNAVLLFVDNEDINENGVLDAALDESNLDETADGVDYNKDGDMLDVGVVADLNMDGDTIDVINEDANGNGFLDDGIDDGDGQWWTSDIVGCVFEQTPVNENNWVPIETVTGDTVGGVVQDLSYPVAVSWDTRDLAAGEAGYNLRVRSWDVENNWLDEGIEIVTVTVDAEGLNAYFNEDPAEVANPTIDGSTVFGTINLYAFSVDPNVTRALFRYSDDAGATWNDIAVDDNPNAGFGGDPTSFRDWAIQFDTSLFPDGDYLFDVVGLDEFGNSDEDPTDLGQQLAVTFMNTPPVLAITSPAAGTIVSMNNGNVMLELEAELTTAASSMSGVAQAFGPIEAQFQVSLDGGTTWLDIDGINSEAANSDVKAGDYFADNPRKGLRMGAYNQHPQAPPVDGWLHDATYQKSVDNSDLNQVEAGDWRTAGVAWTDPMYGLGQVEEGDQDVGTPLIPFVGPFDAGDAMDPAPELFGPWTTSWVSNAHIAHVLGVEMASDVVALIRVEATDVTSGLTAVGPTTEVTVRENADPVVDVIEVTDSDGGLVADSDGFTDFDITSPAQFPDGFTFDDQITIFSRAADNTPAFTNQQGTVSQVQVFYRPRQVDYNFMETIDWIAGPVDSTYPFIIDVDVSGLNGLYEFGLQAVDEGGNYSGIYPQFSIVVQNMEAVATGLPATINEGATITVGADVVSPPVLPVDGGLPPTCEFWASRVALAEELTPEFQTSGSYAGYFTSTLEEDITNESIVDGMDPGTGAMDDFMANGSDAVVDVGGSPGVFHPMDEFLALVSPTALDFTVDYGTDQIIFGADPATMGDVTVDYHYDGWVSIGEDETPPYTIDFTPGFGFAGDWDIVAALEGMAGGPSPTSGVFTRPVALSSDPGTNLEVAHAEWNVLTVTDADAPLFTVGGLSNFDTDTPGEFAHAWTTGVTGAVNLGNAINTMDDALDAELIVSGDELDVAIYETGEELDPATVEWALRNNEGAVLTTGSFTEVNSVNPYEHPVTFTLFEQDFAQVVMGDDIENVRVWIDFNDDNDYDTDVAEFQAEVFDLADMGTYWQTTVTFDSQTNAEYMFLVDTIGNDLDFNLDGTDDPVDDPRNQDPTGAGYEIDQNNGGTPGDSRIDMLVSDGFWANADISGLADGVYFLDFTASDMVGNSSTFTKRFVLDRTPWPQDNVAVSTATERYVGAPGEVDTLFARVFDPATPDVNEKDAVSVAFQYWDGVDWLWCNGGATNSSAGAIDSDPTNGWSIGWKVPDPATDAVDNDGDGFVDEEDEGEFTVSVAAVVRDLGYNVTAQAGAVDFTIDSIAPETSVTLAMVEGDAAPTAAEGRVVTLGDWVELYAPEPSNQAAEAVVFQFSVDANSQLTGLATWIDIDCTPLDPDDDYLTGLGVNHETPDFTADTDVGGTMYYTCRLETEPIRELLTGSGDLFAEVRANAIDAVGNEGTDAATTILVINDMLGPATVVWGFTVPGVGIRYANDPTLVISGNVTVHTSAIGYNPGDVATTTLQWSTTGGDGWSDWTTIGTADPTVSGGDAKATFPVDVSELSGAVWFRAFSADEDGNIGGDEDGNGIIDADEAANVPVVLAEVNNTMPEMALMIFGAAGHTLEGVLSDGDKVMPNALPLETQFIPVLPQNIAVAAWNSVDESPDVWSANLQFYNDVINPLQPSWVTIASMTYRDDPGDFSLAGAPADGMWIAEFESIESLVAAMEAAMGATPAPSREYRFRAQVTSYSGMVNTSEEGIMLLLDRNDPQITDIFVGDEEFEGGGGGIGQTGAAVAGGDLVPIGTYVIDSWDEWIPGSGAPVDQGDAWESSGIYGVRARVKTASGQWETVGMLALDPDANLPGTYTINWETPFNPAWGDSVFSVEIAARDSVGNCSTFVRADAITVQDATPPAGTEIVGIAAVPGAGATFPDTTTETTIREEGTYVRGEVTLTAATAAGDQSISAGGSSVYFQVMPDGGDWITINAGAVNPSLPEGVAMEADMAQGGGAHLGLLWDVAWDTMVEDGQGNAIFPDGHYVGRAWAIDDWGNHELLDGVAEIDIWVDNTAPVAQMDADPSDPDADLTAAVERNDVFTAFARTIDDVTGTEVVDDDVTVEFMIKLATDMNVESSWTTLGPGYDATDVNPDATRPYSFDWWMNQNTPPLVVGADYHIAASATDQLGNNNSVVVHQDAGVGITITIVDTQAPVATITKLVRSVGDPTVITWPDEVCIVGIDSLEATILRGDMDTKFVRFYYRAEGETQWILADGDVEQMGDLTWVLYNWDSSGLPEGRYEFAAVAEDDAGNSAEGPAITLVVNRTGPVFAAVSPESDVMPDWEPSLSAATASYANPGTTIAIGPEGPQPFADGRMAPTGSYTGTASRMYTVTIAGAGNTGAASFDWSGSGGAGSGSAVTGGMVELEDGIFVSFCDGTDTPSFEIGDTFTFHTEGKTVDLIVTTDVGLDDIDPDRVFFEYKLSSDPDRDEYWMRDAVAPCGVLHDDMMNTWSSKWDISGLESCLYDVRLTMWDVCGNWTTDMLAENVIVDNDCPPVAITNIENADEDDTTLEPIDFGQITDVTRGVPVTIWATATDDEPCLPESHETAITQMQFQLSGTAAAGGGGMADIVFILDGSGSMSGEIANAQAAMSAFAGALTGVNVDFALALVDMGGDVSPGKVAINFTSDVNAFQNAVNTFSSSGAMNSFDATTGALSSAYGLSWRPGATRFVILVTDTSPEMGSGSGVNFCSNPSPPEEAAFVSAVGNQAIVHAIVETPTNDTSGCPEDHNCYDGVTSATGGSLWDLNSTDWSGMLSSIAGQIAGAVAGGWKDLGLYEVPVDAGDDPDVTASQLWDTSGLDEGVYYLRVRAYDEADNICTSQMVQVNIVDKTPPLARIAGFDPDVLHGDDENTLERVYAMAYSDDEIVDVQFQYNLDPATESWVTFGVGTNVDGGEFDPLEQNNVPEVWAADFNLSDRIADTNLGVGDQFTLRAVAKDSDGHRIDDFGSDRNSPELLVTIVRNPADGSLALCPGTPTRITDMSVGSPQEDEVVVSVTTDAVNEVPRVLAISEDLTGEDTAQLVTLDRREEIPSSTFQGNVGFAGVMDGGQVAIFATAIRPDGTPAVDMAIRNLVVHPVTDGLGSNGVVGVPLTGSCASEDFFDASVEIPPGSGQEGGLYIGPAGLDVPKMPQEQRLYIDRVGDAYYIDLFGATGDFNRGYEAGIVITYEDADLPEGADENMLAPRYWSGSAWSAVGITNVEVDPIDNEVSFDVNNLVDNNLFSLFIGTGDGAPIEVVDISPWSNGYTDRHPMIRAFLRGIPEGALGEANDIDQGSIQIWRTGPAGADSSRKKVADTAPAGYWWQGKAFGFGDLRLVPSGISEYELIYEHSEREIDGLAAGEYMLEIRFRDVAGTEFVLDPAAPRATFGVDATPVRYEWDPGIANFVLGRDPEISVTLRDGEAGVLIEDLLGDEQGLSDGIKMDVYRVQTGQGEPDGPEDTHYSRNLIQTATTGMLVFDPSIDEYMPGDTLRITYPVRQVNLDAYNGQELEVVLFTNRSTYDNGTPEFEGDDINRYHRAVQDRVGNVASSFVQQRYRIDVCGPSVEFISPQCGAELEPDDDILVTLEISDECSLCEGDCNEDFTFEGAGLDLESIRYEVMTPADTAMTLRNAKINGTRVTFTMPSPLQLGDHTLVVWVSDVLGNETRAECSFTVESADGLLADAYIYPNPVDPGNGGGKFVVNAGQAGAKVSIDVFDFAGNFVATVAHDKKIDGWGFEVPWDGRAEDGTMLASGPYMARVKVRNGDQAVSRTVKVMIWQLNN